MEKMMDRCGLFGMFDNNGFHTSHLIYYGLFSMQHRGMEAAGICVNDNQGNFSYVKDEGLVTEAFDEMRSFRDMQVLVTFSDMTDRMPARMHSPS